MIKNMVIAPIQNGRISIGALVERNGKTLPQKLDSIRVTGNTMVSKNWVDHPVMKTLPVGEDGKLRTIPIRILFDKLESNISANFTCFDEKGRQLCVGDGATAKRKEKGGIDQIACPKPEFCGIM